MKKILTAALDLLPGLALIVGLAIAGKLLSNFTAAVRAGPRNGRPEPLPSSWHKTNSDNASSGVKFVGGSKHAPGMRYRCCLSSNASGKPDCRSKSISRNTVRRHTPQAWANASALYPLPA